MIKKKETTKESILNRLTRDEISHIIGWLHYYAEKSEVAQFRDEAKRELVPYCEALDWIDNVAANDPKIRWRW